MSEINGTFYYSNGEVTHYLTISFAGALIVSTVGLMLFGINCHQTRNYFKFVAKEDPIPTRIWILVVMAINAAATFYQVYYNWICTIEWFNPLVHPSQSAGNTVVLYSVVIMLVQSFWLVCLNAMSPSGSRSFLWITGLTGFGIISSFGFALAVAIVTRIRPNPNGSWPTPEINIYLETSFALDVATNLALLSAILFQLRRMRRESVHIKKGFSRLSYVLCGVTTISIVIIAVEVVIELPRTHTSLFPSRVFNLSFAPIISPLYAFGMLSILNARDDWHGDVLNSESRQTRRTQFTFTEQFPSLIEDQNSINVARSRVTTEQTQDFGSREEGLGEERETQSDLRERKTQRRAGGTGDESEMQSSEYGIQTI